MIGEGLKNEAKVALEDGKQQKQRVYSWSRISSFDSALNGDGCLYNWYKTYIEGDRGKNNFFAEYGTLFHTLIEKMSKGELLAWDVDDEIKKGMAEFEFNVPFPKMRKSYDDSIYNFFNDFENIFADYDIQQSEEEKIFKVGDVMCKGYPDAIGQHKKHGMCIIDFKSSRRYTGDDLKYKTMQMYLYSIPFIEEFGYAPDHLIFMFVREKQDRELVIKFDPIELERTKKFVADTVRIIESYIGEWEAICSKEEGRESFFANQLCNQRLTCPHKNSI